MFRPSHINTHTKDNSEIKGQVSSTTIGYDYLVYAVGAETQTFGIPGVKEYSCFMKELSDAERMQRQFMDCAYYFICLLFFVGRYWVAMVNANANFDGLHDRRGDGCISRADSGRD